MAKLKLDLDALRVDSFGTTAAAGRGTVAGASDPLPQDTGCTAPCMSGGSDCPITSCGSGCDTDVVIATAEPTG